MIPTIEAIVVAGMLATPLPSLLPPAVAAPEVALRPAIEVVKSPGGQRAPGGMRRLAASIAASLVWDLADLPRRRAILPDPIGGFTPGAAFRAPGGSNAIVAGGAIGALITRWNSLYPPYALEGMDYP